MVATRSGAPPRHVNLPSHVPYPPVPPTDVAQGRWGKMVAARSGAPPRHVNLPSHVPYSPVPPTDVAQGRWGKMVAARSGAAPRLKLYEFQALAGACARFGDLLEPHSQRASGAVRLVAQGQCRAYVEALHAKSVAQVRACMCACVRVCVRVCVCVCVCVHVCE